MAFGVDYSAASSDILPEGTYECIIENAKLTTTKFGTPYISIPMVIRSDVETNQRKKCKIFHSMWMKKEPTAADNACEGFSAWQIQNLSKAAGLPNGKNYENLDEWCGDLTGRPVKVELEHSEYKGKTNARVKWFNETEHKNITPTVSQAIDTVTQQSDFQEVIDDDVPF